MPISKVLYQGLPSSRKNDLRILWSIAVPTRGNTYLYIWLKRRPGLSRPQNTSGGPGGKPAKQQRGSTPGHEIEAPQRPAHHPEEGA